MSPSFGILSVRAALSASMVFASLFVLLLQLLSLSCVRSYSCQNKHNWSYPKMGCSGSWEGRKAESRALRQPRSWHVNLLAYKTLLYSGLKLCACFASGMDIIVVCWVLTCVRALITVDYTLYPA